MTTPRENNLQNQTDLGAKPHLSSTAQPQTFGISNLKTTQSTQPVDVATSQFIPTRCNPLVVHPSPFATQVDKS
jgi:hypothetical protein